MESQIELGPLTLIQRKDGSLVVKHKALAQPVPVDDKALARWLLKLLRDQVTA